MLLHGSSWRTRTTSNGISQQASVFETAKSNVSSVGTSAGVGSAADASLPDVVGRLINVALGFIGILLLVYILLRRLPLDDCRW